MVYGVGVIINSTSILTMWALSRPFPDEAIKLADDPEMKLERWKSDLERKAESGKWKFRRWKVRKQKVLGVLMTWNRAGKDFTLTQNKGQTNNHSKGINT